MEDFSQNELGTPKRLWRVGTLTYGIAGLVVLFCWLLWGDFAWSMRDRAVGPVVQLLLKNFGASDTVMALFLSSLPCAIGLFIIPVISYISDRHRGRWGRRIPYIMIITPVAASAMIAIPFSAEIGGYISSIFGYSGNANPTATLTVFGLLWVVFEFAAMATSALFVALINDVVPQSVIGRFFGLFRALSLIAGIIFNYWLIGTAELHSKWLFLGIASVYLFGVLMMCFMVKEGEYPPPPDVTPGHRKGVFAATKTYFKECFSKPYYLCVFLAMTLASLCFSPVNLFSVPFAQSLGINMELYGKYLAVTYVISFCLAYFLGALADRFHPLRLGISALTLYALTMLVCGLFTPTVQVYAVALIAHGVISGTYFTATASLAQRLFPRSTFAQFASACGLMGGLAGMGISPLFGVALDFTGHQYHHTFIMASVIATSALLLMLVVYKQFMVLGGPKNYIAPE